MRVTIVFEVMDGVDASEFENFVENELCKLSDHSNTVEFNICDDEIRTKLEQYYCAEIFEKK